MFIIGKHLNAVGRLKKQTIVSTVMSNMGFYKAVADNGMQSVQTAVGIVMLWKKCVRMNTI